MKRLLSVLMIVTLLLSCGAALPTAAAPAGSINYKNKDLTAYLYSKSEKKTMTCLFRDDLPMIPYVSAVDYLDQLYEVEFKCRKDSQSTFTVSNVNGEMVVDIENDTIHFDDFETLVESDVRPVLEDETHDYLKGEDDYEIIGEQKGLDLDLGAYGIDLTYLGEEVYFPLSAINDIFASTYHGALYLDGALYFIDVMEEEPYYDTASLFSSTVRDKTLVDYTYQELCFAMDHFYGCPSKSRLAKMIGEKGFDQAITSYNVTTAKAKELLLSEDLVDYLYGLLYLDMYMDDGGHTVMSYGLQLGLEDSDSAYYQAFMKSMYDFTDNKLSTIQQYLTEQMTYQTDMENLTELRDEWFDSMTEVKTWDDAAFYQSGTTGVFTFDEFKDSVVKPFKWSLDYAAENGIEDFVIDLSLNGGGSVAVAIYIMSVVCDSTRTDILNTLTGNQYAYYETVDKNLDGEFDEKDDEVFYDLNFAALTSQFSFSAANMLPCLLQDNGIAIVGENSGGGTCAIAIHSDPAGYAYALSDTSKMIYPDGTDVDQGAVPDCALPGTFADYEGFYDIEEIAAGINKFYEEHPRPNAPDKPAQPTAETATDAKEASGDEPGARNYGNDYQNIMPYLMVIGSAVALIFVIAFVVIIIRGAKKKSRIES